MTRTMTANIPGARLRDVERRLALLKGEEAINSFLAEHPNEVKVLEQMVEQRRAGKPVPALTRVQRVMLWSDGHLEFKTDPAPEGRERPLERGPRDARHGRGGDSGNAGPARGGERRERSDRRPGTGPAPRAGSGPRPGGVGPRQGGGPRPGGQRGGPRGRGRSFGEDRGDRGLPRSGEGWVLLREGEKPPEPEPLPEYEWDEDESSQESNSPAADTLGASQKPSE